MMIDMTKIECEVPPPGWVCTREKNHEGPCAAHPTDETVYQMAWERWGAVAQAQMACEECGELIQAVSKFFFRGKDLESSGLVSELADVSIMIEQLIQITDTSEQVKTEKNRKIQRLLERMLDAA